MKDLNILLNHQDENVKEATLKSAINNLYDNILKEEMKDALRDKYGVVKENEASSQKQGKSVAQKSSGIINLRFFLSAAAVFIFGIFTYVYFINAPSPYEMASQYAFADIVKHPGTTKGVSDDSAIKLAAIQAFNAQQWDKAVAQFEAINNADTEVLYYKALSYFYQKNYSKTISILENQSLKESVFGQEVHWYLGLAYFLSHKESEARNTFLKIKPQDWKYKESRTLIQE